MRSCWSDCGSKEEDEEAGSRVRRSGLRFWEKPGWGEPVFVGVVL